MPGWVDETPPDFLFAVKASRYLTHVKRLTELEQGVPALLERIEPLLGSPKLGPDALAAPAARSAATTSGSRLRSTCSRQPHAFEFRHESWFARTSTSCSARHGVALVLADDARRRFGAGPPTPTWSSPFPSRRRERPGNYSEASSPRGRSGSRRWRKADVLVYFNNDWEGFAHPERAAPQELLDV